MALVLELDNQDLPQFAQTAAAFGSESFGYVVTPNADHIIRYCDEPPFRTTYADAQYVLCDSRFLSYIVGATKGLHVPVCTGSDLTEQLITKVAQPDDRLVLVGGTAEQAEQLRRRFGFTQLRHMNPPMGFIRDPHAVEAVLEFVEQQSPFRFCLLAVGCPQQEIVAQQLKHRGIARGLALCIGASVNFITGQEQRAPRLFQRLGLEWAFRLLQSPRRLGHRYLIRGPRVFALLRRIEIKLRTR
jgi:exopolysaccharide biosynthesis WecB/TagA/CpsF family protein